MRMTEVIKFDLEALHTPGGFMKKTGKRIMAPGSWPGLSRFQECDMQQALRDAKARRAGEAEYMEGVRKFVRELRTVFAHVNKTRIGTLVFWVKKLGQDEVWKLAANNLNKYLFEKACREALGQG